MEQNFQTSFIPKKPIIEDRVRPGQPVNIFTIVAVFLLFAAGIATGGLYFYKGTLTKSIDKMKEDLDRAKGRFEPEVLGQLQVLDKRLKASTEILSNHIAVSPIFQALGVITLSTVRYTEFSYDLGTSAGDDVSVKMSGSAIGYRSVALQSDLFLKNKNIIDPVFSNLVLDDKGNVLFDLNFKVDAQFVDYKQMLKVETVPEPEIELAE